MRRLAFTLAAILAAVNGIFAQAGTVTLTPEAMKYTEQVVTPILWKSINNPGEIPAIKNRLLEFSDKKQKEEMDYLPAGSYSPQGTGVIAHIDYDPKTRRLVFLLFVPRVQDTQKIYRKEVFETEVLIFFTHEMIHVEQQSEFGPISSRSGRNPIPADQIEEACAWGKTQLGIVQPLVNAGRSIAPYHIQNLNFFKSIGSNCRDPRWILSIAQIRSF